MSRQNSVELRDAFGNHKRWLTLDEGKELLKTEQYHDYVENIRGKERLIISPRTNPREISGTIAMLGEHEMRANAGIGTDQGVLNVRAKIRAWPHVIDKKSPMFAAGKPSVVRSIDSEEMDRMERGRVGYA